MNTEDKFIQDLFSEKLQHAEAPVDPAVWQGISNALPASGAVAGTAASAGFQMGALGWVAVGLVAVGITVATVVFQTEEKVPVAQKTEVEQFSEEAEKQPSEVEATIELTTEVASEVVQEETRQPSSSSKDLKEQPNETTLVADKAEANKAGNKSEKTESLNEKKENLVANAQEQQKSTTSSQPEGKAPSEPEVKQPNPKLSAHFEAVEAPFEELAFDFIPAFEGATTYFWDFGDGTTSNERQPNHLFAEQGTYDITLTASDKNGFTQVMEEKLNVVLPAVLVLPNTFTPDNNGTNDFLLASVHAKNVEIQSMMVFSTKGELLFEQVGASSGWDGNLVDGSPAPTGDYVLIVKAISSTGENITKQRKVLLQRN